MKTLYPRSYSEKSTTLVLSNWKYAVSIFSASKVSTKALEQHAGQHRRAVANDEIEVDIY